MTAEDGGGASGLPEGVGEAEGVSDVELLAAALRADAADLDAYATAFTNTFGAALPAGMVTVERRRSFADRAAGRPGRAIAVQVHAGDKMLELRAEPGGRPVARVAQEVRGVVISRRDVSFAEWTQLLAGVLAGQARESAAAREALRKLLEG